MGRRPTRGRLGEAAAAFASNWRNPSLRRAQLSFFAEWTAGCAFTVALSVVAFTSGGPLAVGLVGLITVAPSAFLTPLLAPLADRGRRERVLVFAAAVRGAAFIAAAIVVAISGPLAVVLLLAAASAVPATLYRPAHSALLPTLSRSGRELTSANVVRGLLDSTANLIGPAVAAVLIATVNVAAVMAVSGAAGLCAAVLVFGLRYDAPARQTPARRPALMREAIEGIQVVIHRRDLMLVLTLTTAQILTRGALIVFSVVVAVQLLGMGEAGTGTLMAALGAGAVIGSLAVSILVSTWRLGAWFAIGIGLWGLPFALIGVFPQQATALSMLALVGAGNALVDAAGFTLIGRLAPDTAMARVFTLLESLGAIATGAGSMLASALIQWFSIEVALIAIGLFCPALAVASWWRLRTLDRSVAALDAEIGLLQKVPMLDPLPLPAVEQLARGLQTVTTSTGETVFAQGDVGDLYYVIESGEADVWGAGRRIATLGAGEGFGEIALLRSTPRTATVTARTDLTLRTLDAERFTGAVLGYVPSARAATQNVESSLRRYAPGDAADDTAPDAAP